MSFRRVAGIAGILMFLGFLATFFVAGDFPDLEEPGSEWVSFVSDEEGSLRYNATVTNFTFVFFIVFASGLFVLLRNTERGSGDAWAIVGLLGAIFIVAMIGSAFSAQSGLLQHVDSLADEPEAVKALARYDSGAFLTSFLGFTTFLGGMGLAGLRTKVLPKWIAIFALVGAVGSLAPLFGNVAEDAEDSLLGPFGFLGFIVFAIFPLVTGIWMLRTGEAPASTVVPA
ncbi:MAG: DUF4386 family protein [Actinomycetota bacterium]